MAGQILLATLLLFAAGVEAKVCDGGTEKVPCWQLKGGAKMPQVAMGTWSGSYGDCGKNDYTCVKQHARFASETWLHMGGTHIDGANDYRTQTSIAEALQASGLAREDAFITTKCPGAIGYAATIQCADDNLQMLGQFGTHGVSYIDLLLVHFPFILKPACRFNRLAPECQPPNQPYEIASKEELQDTWRAMEELKRIGVVKSIGVSDYNTTQLAQTLEAAKQPIELNQVEWNPKYHDEKMLSYCKDHGIQLQAWSPLGGSHGSVLSDPAVEKIAMGHNVSTAQVTLRWSIQRGVAVVVGTANPAHAQSDMDLFGFVLTDAEVEAISALQYQSNPVHV
jgi:diketogulonate reductase-like aldo/keto reductase